MAVLTAPRCRPGRLLIPEPGRAVITDLAVQERAVGPQSQPPAACAVPDRVGGQLAKVPRKPHGGKPDHGGGICVRLDREGDQVVKGKPAIPARSPPRSPRVADEQTLTRPVAVCGRVTRACGPRSAPTCGTGTLRSSCSARTPRTTTSCGTPSTSSPDTRRGRWREFFSGTSGHCLAKKSHHRTSRPRCKPRTSLRARLPAIRPAARLIGPGCWLNGQNATRRNQQ